MPCPPSARAAGLASTRFERLSTTSTDSPMPSSTERRITVWRCSSARERRRRSRNTPPAAISSTPPPSSVHSQRVSALVVALRRRHRGEALRAFAQVDRQVDLARQLVAGLRVAACAGEIAQALAHVAAAAQGEPAADPVRVLVVDRHGLS